MTDRATLIKNLRHLARIIEDNNLPVPYAIYLDRNEAHWYIQRSINDALAVRAVMNNPQVGRIDSTTFPVDITGSVAGFNARVQVAASIALVAPETVPLPALNPLLIDAAVTA